MEINDDKNAHYLKLCPLCSSALKELNVNYKYCSNCELAISKKPPATYDETYYYGNEGWNKDLIYRSNLLFKIASKFFQKSDLILDFGCNVGIFVDVCNTNLYQTDGVDISEKSIGICKQACKNGHFYFPIEVKRKYDVVTAFDVVEHFDDLNIFMNEIDNYLNKEGLLIITTPNINSQWIRYFGFGWHGFGIPQYHRYILGKKSLEILAAKHGYSIVNCKEHGILEKNGWRYVLGSEYRLGKNKLYKLLKVPKAFMKYLILILSKKYYTDTIFIVLKRNSQ